ncbi:Anaerobic benzoate catabolism transcriptional regulator [Macrococcoides canis]|uniref:Anaerobic benzoate catabolism transcriptional regulator n=1 Tax=Macrococcoides canis TaxID=1855823 RepID=A0A1W7ABU6_9STAP|nr:helix-turn-helix transcriptional regulator [Macrococcus canis]ARQ07078.1 anaerobic benzoate catabolism transcriptional regulator [Macrococcus canis]
MQYRNVNIGAKVRWIRKQKRMSQREFAEHIGISKSYLGDIELNRKKHFTDTLNNLCKKLNMTIDELISIDENGEI